MKKDSTLVEAISEFYSWYMSWVEEPNTHAKVFQLLSELMRLALFSSQGADYLSGQSQKKILAHLALLKESLFTSAIKHLELQSELEHVLDEIMQENPKAKLLIYITELEYTHCIQTFSSSANTELKEYLEELLQLIAPLAPSIQTQALAQILSETLHVPPSENPTPLLQQEVSKWLNSRTSY